MDATETRVRGADNRLVYGEYYKHFQLKNTLFVKSGRESTI